ncbi:DUF3313 domain-containing protein [Erwinia sp.]|uniref:DUF3313 domain-containing protein n=1 Tax=Erwinia citreus TaxID=558 RepID=UPI003C74E1F9
MMRHSTTALVAVAFFLSGCAGTPPARYSGIDSASRLTPNTGDEADRIPFKYSTQVDWNQYSTMIIEPVSIYQGTDGQFGDMSPADRQQLATYMKEKFTASLRAHYQETTVSAPKTLRIKLTLTGADTTTQVIGTFTKFDLAGGPYNIVQSVRGGRGMFSGSVDYAVEVYDAQSNKLLTAYVARQYPNAMNISATIGSLSAAQVGIDKGAEELANVLK